jgi:peptide chain release factor
MLAERIEEIEKGRDSRVAIVGETKRKRKSNAVKKSKRKYRLLETAKSGAAVYDKIEGETEEAESTKIVEDIDQSLPRPT